MIHLPVLGATILLGVVADALTSWCEDHTRRTPAICIAAVVAGSADHVFPELAIVRRDGQILTDLFGAGLDCGDAIRVESDGWTVNQLLPLNLATLFALFLRYPGEFGAAFLLHLGEPFVHGVSDI